MNADHQEQTNGAKAIPASPLSLMVCDCPLTRLLSTALFAPFTRFLADPLGAEESQTCLIRHQRRRSLSAFIRVHPWPFLLLDQHRLHLVRDRPLHQVSPEHAAHRVPKLAQV